MGDMHGSGEKIYRLPPPSPHSSWTDMGEVSRKFKGILEADKSSVLRHNLCKVKHGVASPSWTHCKDE